MISVRFLLPGACALAVAVSCGGKSSPTAAPVVKPKLLSKVYKSVNLGSEVMIAQYYYGSDSTVDSLRTYNDVTGKADTLLIYAFDNGRLVSALLRAPDGQMTYYYYQYTYTDFGAVHILRRFKGISDTVLFTYVYEYNSDQRPSRCSVYSDSTTFIYRCDIDYSGGDIVRVRYLNPGDSTYDTLTYTRDAKNNPYAYLPTALYKESPHNPASLSTSVQLDTSGLFTMTFSGVRIADFAYASSEFDYDVDGWPIVARRHVQSFRPKTFVYRYEYLP